jgi:predicted transcriptional regulator
VAVPPQRAYLQVMDTRPTRPSDDAFAPAETEVERQAELAREDRMLDEADADLVAGRTVSLDAVEAWVDSLGTDQELPVPRSES